MLGPEPASAENEGIDEQAHDCERRGGPAEKTKSDVWPRPQGCR